VGALPYSAREDSVTWRLFKTNNFMTSAALVNVCAPLTNYVLHSRAPASASQHCTGLWPWSI